MVKDLTSEAWSQIAENFPNLGASSSEFRTSSHETLHFRYGDVHKRAFGAPHELAGDVMCRTCSAALLHRVGLLVALHSKDAANFFGYLEPSLRLFWPDARLTACLDSDDEWIFQETILARGVVQDVQRAGLRPFGVDAHAWKQILQVIEGERLQQSTYVGYVDADTLFVAPVIEDALFYDGKPRIIARTGPPRGGNPAWAALIPRLNWFLGFSVRMECMTYFPVVVQRTHLSEFRRYIESRHQKSFAEAYAEWAALGFHNVYTALCNFLWEKPELRASYRWHFFTDGKHWNGPLVPGQASWEEMHQLTQDPNATSQPCVRVAVHAGYQPSLGKLCTPGGEDETVAKECVHRFIVRPLARTARWMLLALCRSLPRGHSVLGCTGRPRMFTRDPKPLFGTRRHLNTTGVFPPWFMFEADEIGWLHNDLAGCLQAQHAFQASIHRILVGSPEFRQFLGAAAFDLRNSSEHSELLPEVAGKYSPVHFSPTLTQTAEEECPMCRAAILQAGQHAVLKIVEAVDMLLRARDAYVEAKLIVESVGGNIQHQELQERVFTGL